MKIAIVLLTVFLQVACFAQSSGLTDSNELIKKEPITLQKSLTIIPENVIPQIDPLYREINSTMLLGIGSLTLGAGLGVHFYQANAWWKEERTKFRFENDWDYALWVDKIGHLYGAYIIQHAISASLEASNMGSEESTLWGAGIALGFQMYVEIEDGFGPSWGFSPGDAVADIIGASFPVLQYYYPPLKNFQFRFSYYPAKLGEEGYNAGQKYIVIDDYEGQKFWLSTRIYNYLPKSVKEYWPEWLMLSVGMGVRNLDGNGGGDRDFYIAFDFDAETLPIFGQQWQFVKNTLNYFHFPMPGIRINNGTAFFMFCY